MTITVGEILKSGFPTTRDENWKYTDLSVLSTKPVELNTSPIVSFKSQEQSGITIQSFTVSKGELGIADVFERLNYHHATEKYRITLSKNLSAPLEIHYLSDKKGWSQPRIEIIVEPNVDATVIEIFEEASNNSSVMNTVTEITLKENAALHYYKVQAHDAKSVHIGRTHVQLAAHAALQTFTLSKGSQLARSDIHVTFQGEHAACHLYGLSHSSQRQHLDHHTVIDHAVPHCESHEFYRSILEDKSRVVFNGKVIVREGAHHTEANQANDNLLLSSDAEIDTKPELEIYHDDVKCSHGATIGQLDETAMFYLRSRGLNENEARAILIQAFGAKVLQSITDEKMRERLCQY